MAATSTELTTVRSSSPFCLAFLVVCQIVPPSMKGEVAIIGAGISGLSAALDLQRQGLAPEVFEASDSVGGRVRTDLHQGFRLDRGFQILNTAYPTAQRLFDYAGLHLRRFTPGARVRIAGRWHDVPDPLRSPSARALIAALRAPIGSLADKARLAWLRHRLRRTPVDAIWAREAGPTTLARLEQDGFSPAIIERFFRPFYGGVFLEAELSTDARLFDFTFKMFAEGEATLPRDGIQALPEQLAAQLARGTVSLRRPVARLEGSSVHFADGTARAFDAVIVACDPVGARRLLGIPGPAPVNAVTCFYFASDRAPYSAPVIALDADPAATIQTFCVPSLVQPSYAPAGQHLLSASVLGEQDPSARAPKIEREIRDRFPELATARLDFLRSYPIAEALPRQWGQATATDPGIFLAGDHTRHASLEGALVSGLDAASAVRSYLQSPASRAHPTPADS